MTRSCASSPLPALMLAALLCAGAARAADTITLPLDGYYHPGRYMPVHVKVAPESAKEADGQVCLTSSGSVWTFVRYDGGPIDAVVPWLAIDGRAVRLNWRRGFGAEYPVDTALHPLDDRQRLVAFAGTSTPEVAAVVATIYPDDPVIPVPLDLNQPLPGNPACWETLDAVVLDAATAARLKEAQFASLVAGGTAFAVRGGSAAPWPAWPWKHEGDWWTIHHVPAGPQASRYDEATFLPVAGWHAGWADVTRKRLVMACALFALVVLGVALWRPPATWLIALAVTAVFVSLLSFWGRWHAPTISVGSKIRVLDGGIAQDDDWAYLTCHVRVATLSRWVDVTKPMYASQTQLDLSVARIVCYANGDPDFVFAAVNPNTKVALLARRAGPRGHVAEPSQPVTSPMLPLVKERYLAPGDHILGELPSGPLLVEQYHHVDRWPAIVIERGRHAGP